MITKETYLKIAILLPLVGGGQMMKIDIMNASENRYLNLSHEDFHRTISEGKTAMRKNLEWAIQNAFDEGLLIRGQIRGEYSISNKGMNYIEDFAANINVTYEKEEEGFKISSLMRYFTNTAIQQLKYLYMQKASTIAMRQAKEVFQMLNISRKSVGSVCQ